MFGRGAKMMDAVEILSKTQWFRNQKREDGILLWWAWMSG